MQARPRSRPFPLLGLVAALAVGLAARAADLRPSWECLPEDTVMMVRMPRAAGFLDALRTRTKFGAVTLSPERLRKAWALAVERWGGSDGKPGSLEDLEERLATYGLGPTDMEAAFAGEVGMGVVMQRRDDGQPPVMVTVVWMEPGAEPAERMVVALRRLLEENEDGGDEAAPRRVDVEMAGHEVTWFTRPILQADLGDIAFDGEFNAERLNELRAELAERARKAPKVAVGDQHCFIARLGGRLIVAQSIPPSANAPWAGGAEATDDAARADAGEQARGVFERFLAAHAGEAAAPLADVLEAPGMRATLPGGEALIEAMVDPRPFLVAATGDNDEARRRLEAVGLGTVGPAALKQSFDGGLLRQGLFVTLPAPRGGLFRILDQECDAAEVPSFVTSEAVEFTQISLDLARAYATIKEFAIAEGGEQATNMFTTAEVQAQAWLGVDLETMLANLGSRHWIIDYPAQMAAAIEEARRNPRNAGPGGAPMADRSVVMWKLVDDAPVAALLPKVAALTQTQVVEEQGFQGIRLPGGVSVFVGQGHLVLALGGDSLEKTIAGIRNPPAGAASFRESDVPRKAGELVNLGPCRVFSVGDATRTGGMLGTFRDMVAAMVPDDVEEQYRDVLAKAQALVPTADEMQGMFGVGATAVDVNDAGIAIRSAWEMPAP